LGDRRQVETTLMSPRAWDGKYIFQLAEVLVFSGEENVALQKPVQISSPEGTGGLGWNQKLSSDNYKSPQRQLELPTLSG
jgi:hypothetical protein